MLRSLLCLPALALLAAAAAGQWSLPASLQPNGAELGRDTTAPLMASECRIQQFYELAEVGAPAGPLVIRALSLRFDGPSGGGPAVRHTIDSLTIHVGATHRGVDQLGSVFASNLTLPLQVAYQASGYGFVSDADATAGPEPWGGPGGELRFELTAPVTVAVPPGGCLVFEILTRGNSNAAGADPARLDYYVEAAAVTRPGTSVSAGFGCGPTLGTQGQYEPGTAFFVQGSGYTPGLPVITIATTGLLPWFLHIPGTPACWLYVDLATGGVSNAMTGDPNGGVKGGVPLPRAPQLCGALLYLQNVGLTQPSASNPAGIVVSNYRTVDLGCTAPPAIRGWHVANTDGSSPKIGSVSQAGGLAMRIE